VQTWVLHKEKPYCLCHEWTSQVRQHSRQACTIHKPGAACGPHNNFLWPVSEILF
jgi:hypothetical protein